METRPIFFMPPGYGVKASREGDDVEFVEFAVGGDDAALG
jgi:hypothetical protein